MIYKYVNSNHTLMPTLMFQNLTNSSLNLQVIVLTKTVRQTNYSQNRSPAPDVAEVGPNDFYIKSGKVDTEQSEEIHSRSVLACR